MAALRISTPCRRSLMFEEINGTDKSAARRAGAGASQGRTSSVRRARNEVGLWRYEMGDAGCCGSRQAADERHMGHDGASSVMISEWQNVFKRNLGATER